MPLKSEAAAIRWRDEQPPQRTGIGSRTKAAATAAIPPWNAATPPPPPADDENETQTEIDLLRSLTNEARGQIRAAKSANERSAAVRNYTQLLDSLRKYEKEYPAILKAMDDILRVCEVENAGALVVGQLHRHFQDFAHLAAREMVSQAFEAECKKCGRKTDHVHTDDAYGEIEERFEDLVQKWIATVRQFPFIVGGADDPRQKNDGRADEP